MKETMKYCFILEILCKEHISHLIDCAKIRNIVKIQKHYISRNLQYRKVKFKSKKLLRLSLKINPMDQS